MPNTSKRMAYFPNESEKDENTFSFFLTTNTKMKYTLLLTERKFMWRSTHLKYLLYQVNVTLLCNFIEITLQHGCSPVNLLYIFKTPFLKNTSGRLFLDVTHCSTHFS